MKKTLLYALAGAFALAGITETVPARAEGAGPSPRSLEELRAEVRGEAMTSLKLGQLQEVRHRRWHKRRYVRRRGVFRSRTMSRVHRRGAWCGKYVGRRCYYTPRALRPFRQR
ncbi:hypothetical protein [Chenggangzhangella methanolivorans]|uniref:Uncharacterized protein n=1 Tax=Chenggangzhangella methanolivorans TaxID=1437009 RepID=A0A9E6UMI9_9HYPH|nr:hypothetical protein [Chenggangzhangella methanolivorans]QZN99238.1 hypothetical protein K6K41_20870 [Chenggangzhangella methanolivorans]